MEPLDVTLLLCNHTAARYITSHTHIPIELSVNNFDQLSWSKTVDSDDLSPAWITRVMR